MYLHNNISLVGFMGSGKTTVGKLLSEDLSFLFIDTDRIIEHIKGIKIKEIFNKYGEEYFRKIESDILNKIYCNKKCVFACGGGIFTVEKNIRIIKENSIIFFLDVSPQEAYRRIAGDDSRPLLDSSVDLKKRIVDLISSREESYNNHSDYKIKVDGKTPQLIKDEIKNELVARTAFKF